MNSVKKNKILQHLSLTGVLGWPLVVEINTATKSTISKWTWINPNPFFLLKYIFLLIHFYFSAFVLMRLNNMNETEMQTGIWPTGLFNHFAQYLY